MSSPLDWIDAELAAWTERGLRRQRMVRDSAPAPLTTVAGRPLVNFATNDYLSLAGDPRLMTAARTALLSGVGAGASPLVSGYSAWHARLEARLAQFEGTEAALLFNSGTAANLGTIAALAGPRDCIFGDHANHASLIDGCRLSGARFRTFPHNRLERLEQLLAREPARRRLIVVDSVYSMDGDLAPLADLAALAERFEAMLLVDEAHGTGVFGAGGRGAVEYAAEQAPGLHERVHIRIGTLSKALGCAGGFVAGPQKLIDWLVNRARTYVFSTALPDLCAAAGCAALDIVESEPQTRRQLLATAGELRQRLHAQGWKTEPSASQIIPLIVGEPERAMELTARLQGAGIWAPAIRPPSVPQGTSRLRLSLCSGHTPEMLDRLLTALGPA